MEAENCRVSQFHFIFNLSAEKLLLHRFKFFEYSSIISVLAIWLFRYDADKRSASSTTYGAVPGKHRKYRIWSIVYNYSEIELVFLHQIDAKTLRRYGINAHLKWLADLEKLIKASSSKCNQFICRRIFIDDLIRIIIDCTKLFRESKWKFYLSALRCAIPLLFSFDRHSYWWWTPLCYSGCLLLNEVFTDLYRSFMDGDFTFKFTQRKCSAVLAENVL